MVKAPGKSHASRDGEPDDEQNAVCVLRLLRACVQRAAGWLRVWRPGLASAAVVVGAEAGLAAVAFRWLSYGTIYTRKLLRRGIDIDMPAASDVTAAPAVPAGGSLVEIRPAEGTSELVSAGGSR